MTQTYSFRSHLGGSGLDVGGEGGGGGFLLAQETSVNQIVKDEVFLSSHLEWISVTSGSRQRRLTGCKGSSACLHMDRGRGSVLCTLLK